MRRQEASGARKQDGRVGLSDFYGVTARDLPNERGRRFKRVISAKDSGTWRG